MYNLLALRFWSYYRMLINLIPYYLGEFKDIIRKLLILKYSSRKCRFQQNNSENNLWESWLCQVLAVWFRIYYINLLSFRFFIWQLPSYSWFIEGEINEVGKMVSRGSSIELVYTKKIFITIAPNLFFQKI